MLFKSIIDYLLKYYKGALYYYLVTSLDILKKAFLISLLKYVPSTFQLRGDYKGQSNINQDIVARYSLVVYEAIIGNYLARFLHYESKVDHALLQAPFPRQLSSRRQKGQSYSLYTYSQVFHLQLVYYILASLLQVVGVKVSQENSLSLRLC